MNEFTKPQVMSIKAMREAACGGAEIVEVLGQALENQHHNIIGKPTESVEVITKSKLPTMDFGSRYDVNGPLIRNWGSVSVLKPAGAYISAYSLGLCIENTGTASEKQLQQLYSACERAVQFSNSIIAVMSNNSQKKSLIFWLLLSEIAEMSNNTFTEARLVNLFDSRARRITDRKFNMAKVNFVDYTLAYAAELMCIEPLFFKPVSATLLALHNLEVSAERYLALTSVGERVIENKDSFTAEEKARLTLQYLPLVILASKFESKDSDTKFRELSKEDQAMVVHSHYEMEMLAQNLIPTDQEAANTDIAGLAHRLIDNVRVLAAAGEISSSPINSSFYVVISDYLPWLTADDIQSWMDHWEEHPVNVFDRLIEWSIALSETENTADE